MMSQSEYRHYARWRERFAFSKSGPARFLDWIGWHGDLTPSNAAFELYALLSRRIVADITEAVIRTSPSEVTDAGEPLELSAYQNAIPQVLAKIPKPGS